ncbi:dUTP diphosphatase [Pseudoclavibacter sp. CFCC 11306]|uniref:dUTP diphosphatase n=1 Tax=Pseudoclavibacter sp. CFCC 11306 TaxID=1564493 RepID=UPI001300E06E|nr:dUTP diphosphatase [Pseudoclavibacter sp. CFCC 11306]KAB1658352.1 dUTP diphosphatase [Pseudoclavibacter sp. CFCC 11306]
MNSNVQVLFAGAAAPVYARPGDAGADLCSNESATVPAKQRAVIGTGLSIALPEGCVGLVHPRSGLALHSGITVLNAPGTIDAGYRGEIKVILLNTSDQDFTVRPGDRIAQLVVQRFEHVEFVEVERLPGSARASQGFGSTGV